MQSNCTAPANWCPASISLSSALPLCPLPAAWSLPSHLPPNVLTESVEWETEKSLMLFEYCSAASKNMGCHQHWFSQQSKSQHHVVCYENNLVSRAYRTSHWILKLLRLKNLFIEFFFRQQELLPNWLLGGGNLWKAVTWITISTGLKLSSAHR